MNFWEVDIIAEVRDVLHYSPLSTVIISYSSCFDMQNWILILQHMESWFKVKRETFPRKNSSFTGGRVLSEILFARASGLSGVSTAFHLSSEDTYFTAQTPN